MASAVTNHRDGRAVRLYRVTWRSEVPELAALLEALVPCPVPDLPEPIIARSRWRRAHQAAARRAHYRAHRK